MDQKWNMCGTHMGLHELPSKVGWQASSYAALTEMALMIWMSSPGAPE
jgi:hypothetical protein